MTTATATRAASVAEIHLAPINASRRRAGLPAMTLAEAEREFADVDRAPFRAKAVAPRTTSNTVAVDTMWGGIVAKLNSSVPSRAPIAAVRTSPASSAAAGRVDAAVDWSSIAAALNREAGLKTPASRAR
jgi:hypothetical protein